MARIVTVRTEGFKELEAALLELPKATGLNVAKRALLKAGEPIAAAAAANAPRRTGRLAADIEVSTKLAQDVPKGRSKAEVYIGPSRDPRGQFVEFGTARTAPQPFLRPAFDANAQTALAIIRTELKTEIDKAVARRARKLARQRS
jgi:HK97 gp10 family phage protein